MQIKQRLRQLQGTFTLNRSKFIFLLIALFSVFILLSSIGGSQTGLFNEQQGAPTFQDDPQSVDIPNSEEGGFNLSNFGDPPEGFNPPSNLVGNLGGEFGGGGFGELPEPGEFELPDPGQVGGGGGGIDVPPLNPPTADPPTPPEPPGGGGNILDPPDPSKPRDPTGPGPKPPDGSSIDIPDRPNKARNLLNLSTISLFPDSGFEINLGGVTAGFPSISANNIVFAIIIISMLYLPKSVIARLLEEARDGDTDNTSQQQSMFFKPDEEEIQKRKERERKQRLVYLSDYLMVIVQAIEKKRSVESPKDIMMWTYLELDVAFAKFSKLRRDPSLTPLEHAHLTFEEHEIDNNALEGIVNLFYLTRFGNRDMEDSSIDQLIELIKQLVIEDPSEENSSSRWSFFG